MLGLSRKQKVTVQESFTANGYNWTPQTFKNFREGSYHLAKQLAEKGCPLGDNFSDAKAIQKEIETFGKKESSLKKEFDDIQKQFLAFTLKVGSIENEFRQTGNKGFSSEEYIQIQRYFIQYAARLEELQYFISWVKEIKSLLIQYKNTL